MLTQETNLELFADYFQFYLQDELVDGDLADAWTQDAVDRMLAITKGTIGVGTVRNMDVPVTIKIFSEEPAFSDPILFDQINECDIEIPSGKIVVAGCTEYFRDAKRLQTKPGLYRVRIYYQKFDTLHNNGLEGDDSYELHLWKTEYPADVIIHKQYVRPASSNEMTP